MELSGREEQSLAANQSIIPPELISESDRDVMFRAGYGRRIGYGSNPAVLVIDVTYKNSGYPGKSLETSMEEFRSSCGPRAWDAIVNMQTLLSESRRRQLPIVFTGKNSDEWAPRLKGTKNSHHNANDLEAAVGGMIVEDLGPWMGDVVVRKHKASAFFGTPLVSYLNSLRVDSLIVCGTSTSGCVRATVQDAFAHDLKVAVVRECVFDRIEATHLINLFDMDCKYADVVSLADVLEHLRVTSESLGDRV